VGRVLTSLHIAFLVRKTRLEVAQAAITYFMFITRVVFYKKSAQGANRKKVNYIVERLPGKASCQRASQPLTHPPIFVGYIYSLCVCVCRQSSLPEAERTM
jgi:hypothetical protein